MSTRSVNSWPVAPFSVNLIWVRPEAPRPDALSEERKHQELSLPPQTRIKIILSLFRSYVLPVQFSPDFSLTTILIINKAKSFPSVAPDKDVFGASFILNERCYSSSPCAISERNKLGQRPIPLATSPNCLNGSCEYPGNRCL